jgi:predicted TIM-barrel fold metal-dependent hydrolase
MKIDAFTHIFPKAYWERMVRTLPDGRDMHKRVRAIPSIVDLDVRFRIMDEFGADYRQVLTLGSPPIEVFSGSESLARVANDGMAELVDRYPERFFGFAASLPMDDIEAALREAERAVGELGALGVQVFTNINGRPLYTAQTLPLFDLMARHDLPMWMHPACSTATPASSSSRTTWAAWSPTSRVASARAGTSSARAPPMKTTR